MPAPTADQDRSGSPQGEGAELRAAGSAPPAPPLYQPGDIIANKYCLTRIIGKGGMGAVWLARNEKLDVDVAIKLIRHELGTAEASERLLQEARAAARIGHRSIVRVFDFGETELDDPFIVMEVLTGESLREVLERRGRIPAVNAVRTILPIASALVEAHASGIVHRDLKPENIMLVPDKSGGALPKLLDFGIAKFIRADGGPDSTGRTRIAAGTPDYMAPEQATGHDEVGERADVWALAVILYEAVTGRAPFSGPNYTALVFAIMTAEPDATHEQMAGDAELWGILQTGLAKRDVDRPTMDEFGTALARWALARGIESDIAGTSLAAHWMNETTRSPFSEVPPEVVIDVDVAIPRPAGVPAGLHARLKSTPSEEPASVDPEASGPGLAGVSARRSGVAVLVGALLVAAAVIAAFALRGRAPLVTMGGDPPNPPAQPVPGAHVSARATIATGAPVEIRSAPPVPVETASPVASTPEPLPVDVPAASTGSASRSAPVRSAASSRTLPGAKKPPRKGDLPIAKQPNF